MSQGEPLTSASLLGRLGQQPFDKASWDEFVQRYTPMLQNWCRQQNLQPSDTDDVIQIVLQRLAQAMPRFKYDPDKRFRGFLRTVTKNALNDLRKKWFQPGRGAGGSDVLRSLQALPAQESLEDCLHQGLELQMVVEEAKRRVQLRIKPETWELYRLYMIEDCSGAEVAQRLGKKVATISGVALRVLRMIKEEIVRLQEKGKGNGNLSP